MQSFKLVAKNCRPITLASFALSTNGSKNDSFSRLELTESRLFVYKITAINKINAIEIKINKTTKPMSIDRICSFSIRIEELLLLYCNGIEVIFSAAFLWFWSGVFRLILFWCCIHTRNSSDIFYNYVNYLPSKCNDHIDSNEGKN